MLILHQHRNILLGIIICLLTFNLIILLFHLEITKTLKQHISLSLFTCKPFAEASPDNPHFRLGSSKVSP
jgi:hypothetical protein